MSKDFKIHIHGRCPNCKEAYVNPKQFPYLLCRGFKVPLAIRHTFTPEPTEDDKKMIHQAALKIQAAKRLDKAWPGAHITDQGDHLHFEFTAHNISVIDIQEALRAAGWELIERLIEPERVSGRLRELVTTPQSATE